MFTSMQTWSVLKQTLHQAVFINADAVLLLSVAGIRHAAPGVLDVSLGGDDLKCSAFSLIAGESVYAAIVHLLVDGVGTIMAISWRVGISHVEQKSVLKQRMGVSGCAVDNGVIIAFQHAQLHVII